MKMSVSMQEGCEWLSTHGFNVDQTQFLDF